MRRNASFRETELSALHTSEPGVKGRARSHSLDNTTEENKISVDQLSPTRKVDGEIEDQREEVKATFSDGAE